MPTWPPDLLTISLIANALLGLGLILMFVHLKGGIKAVEADTTKLFHHVATAQVPTVNVTPPTVDPAQLDAAVAKALAARGVPMQTSGLATPSAQNLKTSAWRQT